MFKKLFFVAFLLVFAVLTNSCATSHRNSQQKILPRESFVKIHKLLTVYICSEEEQTCQKGSFVSSASGAVTTNGVDGSYVLTAEHVCDESYLKQFAEEVNATKYELEFKVIDIDGNRYDIEIVAEDAGSDICLLWVQDLHKKSIQFSPKEPVPGDRLYNVAAPLGIFAPNMIPIQEGFYNGYHKDKAFYSIPAAGGSSGSPVLNHKGELVGMIHSTYTRFHHVSLGPTYDNLRKFLQKETKRHSAQHAIDVYIRVLVGMQDSK